jgi:HEXXH motif-containing protein
VIATHSLSAGAFAELSVGVGDGAVIGKLREVQLSKHLMLLRVVADAAGETAVRSPAMAAFRSGYRLLAQAQAADPAAVGSALGLPHFGSWAHDCLARLDAGRPPDYGYLAAFAAAVAVRLGIGFDDLAVPVREGCVVLPGLGRLLAAGPGEWISLSSDGERLRVAELYDVECIALTPDDGTDSGVPHWRGTPLVRAASAGQTWEVLIEDSDVHLDRFALPMHTALDADVIVAWRDRIQSAWELLVRHHSWAAEPIAAGVSVIVPLIPRSALDSATSPAAFGAIATSLPPSAVITAETLVHEFQHLKLAALMDMLPLTETSDIRGYAPWRDDPRPVGGMLQGVYAFAGIVHFWDVQRQVETDPDDSLRAQVLYERWRRTIGPVIGTLLDSGALTADGVRVATALQDWERNRKSAPVPAEARQIATEIDLDNRLTWELRHTAVDPAEVAGLAAAFDRGEPIAGQVLPRTWLKDEIREVRSIARSRLLNRRFQDPRGFRRLSDADLSELGAADAQLIRGNAEAAIAAYQADLVAEPDPAAWLGLALAIHRQPAAKSQQVLTGRLPLLVELHECLAAQGIHADPLELAAWFE